MKNAFFLFFIIVCFAGQAQNDSIQKLDEVVVNASKRLKQNSKTYKVTSISDSVIVNNLESFTSLLRFNSPIYLKEYGQGGTSSASFRGTSSSNTAVMWNGININSINNGQTGFNSLTVGLYDAIDIRSGGGSIEYGSGAIGGTIHLQDNLQFADSEIWKNQFVGSIGSFTTLSSLYKLKYASKKYTFNFGVSYNSSDNDYPFQNSDYKNTNGAYKNITINFANSYKFSNQFKLDFYSTTYFGGRFLSGELPNPTSANEAYKDINHRNLLSLHYTKNKIDITTRVAYLFQEYQYFADKNSSTYNFGSSDRVFADVTLDYKLPTINAVLTSTTKYESVFGRTDRIQEKNRREFSQSFMFNQSISPRISYDIKVRKDVNSDYKVPVSYSFGFRVKPYNQFFVRANTSKNYRVPTYNDLYWPGQGNKNLIPESSLQGEFGLGYKSNNFFVDIAYFTIYSKDKIVWTPSGDPKRPGVWTPINVEKTKNNGVELSANIQKMIYKNVNFSTSLNYSYTIAKNNKKNKLLTFVPKHLINTNTMFSLNRFSVFFQQLFNGKVYITEDNEEDSIIESYYVLNTGFNYNIIQKAKQRLQVGFKINNILNKNYQVLSRRPMPGINYKLNINYKF